MARRQASNFDRSFFAQAILPAAAPGVARRLNPLGNAPAVVRNQNFFPRLDKDGNLVGGTPQGRAENRRNAIIEDERQDVERLEKLRRSQYNPPNFFDEQLLGLTPRGVASSPSANLNQGGGPRNPALDDISSSARFANQARQRLKAEAYSLEITEQIGKTATPRSLDVAKADFLRLYPDHEDLIPTARSPEEILRLKQLQRLGQDQKNVDDWAKANGQIAPRLTLDKDGQSMVFEGFNESFRISSQAKASERADKTATNRQTDIEFSSKLRGVQGRYPKPPEPLKDGTFTPGVQKQYLEDLTRVQADEQALFSEWRTAKGLDADPFEGQPLENIHTGPGSSPVDAIPPVDIKTANEFRFNTPAAQITPAAQSAQDRHGFPIISSPLEFEEIKDKIGMRWIRNRDGALMRVGF